MNRNYIFKNINHALPELMDILLQEGDLFESRAGATRELTFVGITLEEPWQREITSKYRKANIAAQIAETMWVLAGRNDVAFLKNYLPRAADFSNDGRVWRSGYGPRLRNYMGVDQLAYIVDTLRANLSSRQAVATIWDPTVDTTPDPDVACNNWLSFSCRDGELDLMVGIRSNDAMWGWSGINAFEWSALLEIVAGLVGVRVGQLHFAVTSFHLYDQHWEKAQRLATEEVDDDFRDSPAFEAPGLRDMKEFDALFDYWFSLERYIRTGGTATAEINAFPEPMLRSWLQVLQWYWSGDATFLIPIAGTRLDAACTFGLKPAGAPQDPEEDVLPGKPDMLDHVNALHREKAAAYGDSWKRRGESGILGNIARKVDRIRLGGNTRDENQADTAQDLLVYLGLYRCWLAGDEGNPEQVAEIFKSLCVVDYSPDFDAGLDRLFNMEYGPSSEKIVLVNGMLDEAYTYALSLW